MDDDLVVDVNAESLGFEWDDSLAQVDLAMGSASLQLFRRFAVRQHSLLKQEVTLVPAWIDK